MTGNDRPNKTHADSALTRRQLLGGALAGGALISTGGLASAFGAERWDAQRLALTNAKRIKQGGVLHVGVAAGGATDTLDAHRPVSDADISRVFQLYDPLLSRDANFELKMMLAESIESNKTATAWTVRLRPGVTFHNGKQVTADDVLYSLRRISNPSTDGAGDLASVDFNATKKVDQRTVRIALKYPNADFPDDLGQYYNGIVPVGYDPRRPVGTGPFMLKSFSPGQQSQFVRNPHYWQGHVNLDAVVIIDLPDPTARYNALQSGSVDGIQSLPFTSVSAAKSAGLQVVISKTGNWMPFTMRVDQKPFTDVRVRQAMRLLVNRPQMIQQAYDGYGRVGNDLFAPFDPDYASSLPQRHQDIAHAKSLLRAAGQSDLRVSLTTAPYAAGMLQAAEVLAQQAAQAGVTIKLSQVDAGTLYGPNYLKWTFSEDYWYTRNYIPQALRTSVSYGANNETHFNDPQYDKLIKQAQGTVDPAKRKQILLEAQQIEWNTGGLIVWSFFDMIDAYGPKVTGFQSAKSGIPMSNWGFWHLAFTA